MANRRARRSKPSAGLRATRSKPSAGLRATRNKSGNNPRNRNKGKAHRSK